MIKSYTIQERQPDFSWLDIGTTEIPEFVFEVGKTYRILTNYSNQLGSVASDKFTLDSAPILGQSSLSNFACNTVNSVITPISNPPSLFYTFFTNEIINDEFINEGKQSSTATKFIELASNPPTLFYTFSDTENIDDEFINEGKQYTTATQKITPISTPPTLFFTT